MNKQQSQVAALIAVLVVIVGVIAAFYWRELLPTPNAEGQAAPTAPTRLDLGAADAERLFRRDDFKSLGTFGDVPVKVLPTEGNPFMFGERLKTVGGGE
jgi:hypothetical protein